MESDCKFYVFIFELLMHASRVLINFYARVRRTTGR